MATSLPLQYGTQIRWVHRVDAEVLLLLLQHVDHKRTTWVPAGVAKAVNQLPRQWLREELGAHGQHAEHPFWFPPTASRHSGALLPA